MEGSSSSTRGGEGCKNNRYSGRVVWCLLLIEKPVQIHTAHSSLDHHSLASWFRVGGTHTSEKCCEIAPNKSKQDRGQANKYSADLIPRFVPREALVVLHRRAQRNINKLFLRTRCGKAWSHTLECEGKWRENGR